ncbi:helix-turn-helix domain-containing protein [Rufibacter sp. XAAS-G3-1]|uniref:helix-turn-helix domain-containing protein n=1 Tax=Rufibacter sp. XAAS-G3-1 TaxID=2729134 RepID=UPI0015E7C9D4|nr:helix-turn-helix domain-containing protein [Rufibacter sp. XAAS-G3-1]
MSNIRIERACQHCGASFEAKSTVTKYCGLRCGQRAYKLKVKLEKIEATKKEAAQVPASKPFEELKAKEYLTIEELTQLLPISRRTVYRLIDRGELRVGKLGRRTLIRRSDIDLLFTTPKTPEA